MSRSDHLMASAPDCVHTNYSTRVCKTTGVRRLRLWLWRLLRERSDGMTRSGLSELRIGEDQANILLGDRDAGVKHPPSGEPASVEADEAAWQRERERRERAGRS